MKKSITQRRESCLIAENNRIKTQLGDAKATADLWIQKAKQADDAANDLVAELIDTRREWKAETEEQARLLGMSAERECDLRGELERERALADRLVKVVEHSAKIIGPPDSEHDSRWVTDDELDDLWNRTQSALAAWKEARND